MFSLMQRCAERQRKPITRLATLKSAASRFGRVFVDS